jgi:hypothetical protein
MGERLDEWRQADMEATPMKHFMAVVALAVCLAAGSFAGTC